MLELQMTDLGAGPIAVRAPGAARRFRLAIVDVEFTAPLAIERLPGNIMTANSHILAETNFGCDGCRQKAGCQHQRHCDRTRKFDLFSHH